jgi:hypothetical protein
MLITVFTKLAIGSYSNPSQSCYHLTSITSFITSILILSFTELVRLKVSLYICIREMMGSNLDREMAILTNFCGFTQSLQVNYGIASRLGKNRLLPNLFQIICHPTIRYYIVPTLKNFKNINLFLCLITN